MTPIEMRIDEQPTQEQLATVEQSPRYVDKESEGKIVMVPQTNSNSAENLHKKKSVQIDDS